MVSFYFLRFVVFHSRRQDAILPHCPYKYMGASYWYMGFFVFFHIYCLSSNWALTFLLAPFTSNPGVSVHVDVKSHHESLNPQVVCNVQQVYGDSVIHINVRDGCGTVYFVHWIFTNHSKDSEGTPRITSLNSPCPSIKEKMGLLFR